MLIIGCDYHPGFQQIAFVETATGDCGERRLEHREEAEKFYRELAARGMKVRVGMEASGHGGTQLRVVDRRRKRDPCEASTQAKDGSSGCATDSGFAAGRPLSADLGTELGESRSTATTVAPAPDGAGPHPDHEPTASGGDQRRTPL